MPKRPKSEIKVEATNRPCYTPEGQENVMIDLAIKCAEKQLREGTASSQVIVHYLKLGSSRERLEQELTRKQISLTAAKEESLKAVDEVKQLCEDAMAAMKRYSPGGGNDDVLYEPGGDDEDL